MRLGTKSLLFGAHCLLIHPFAVARAWMRLYGFPRDYRLWFAFFLHDIGYWGCADLDGPEGKFHPYLGARLMTRLFDKEPHDFAWYEFMRNHSRSAAKRTGSKPSRLCWADKLSLSCTPDWLWLFCARLSGEDKYYMRGPHSNLGKSARTAREWLSLARAESRAWMAGQLL